MGAAGDDLLAMHMQWICTECDQLADTGSRAGIDRGRMHRSDPRGHRLATHRLSLTSFSLIDRLPAQGAEASNVQRTPPPDRSQTSSGDTVQFRCERPIV